MKGNIPWMIPKLTGKEIIYIDEAIKSNWISDGDFLRRFENDFSDFIGVKHSVAVSNGTGAIHLAMLSLDLSEGYDMVFIARKETAKADYKLIQKSAKDTLKRSGILKKELPI